MPAEPRDLNMDSDMDNSDVNLGATLPPLPSPTLFEILELQERNDAWEDLRRSKHFTNYGMPPSSRKLLEGSTTIMGVRFSVWQAYSYRFQMRILLNKMKYTVSQIEEFDLVRLSEHEDYNSSMLTLVQSDPSPEALHLMAVRDGIAQRHVSIYETTKDWHGALDTDVEVDPSCPIWRIRHMGSHFAMLRNRIAHQYGNIEKDYRENDAPYAYRNGMYAQILEDYKEVIDMIDQVLPAIEQAIADPSVWDPPAPRVRPRAWSWSATIDPTPSNPGVDADLAASPNTAVANHGLLSRILGVLTFVKKKPFDLEAQTGWSNDQREQNMLADGQDAKSYCLSRFALFYKWLYFRSLWVRKASRSARDYIDDLSYEHEMEMRREHSGNLDDYEDELDEMTPLIDQEQDHLADRTEDPHPD